MFGPTDGKGADKKNMNDDDRVHRNRHKRVLTYSVPPETDWISNATLKRGTSEGKNNYRATRVRWGEGIQRPVVRMATGRHGSEKLQPGYKCFYPKIKNRGSALGQDSPSC
jgi:hypothetical protein